jgi:hypothetical protein
MSGEGVPVGSALLSNQLGHRRVLIRLLLDCRRL